ncbi:MAG: tetratricopeptide repeat protein [Ekhidna sp.]
MKSTKILFLLLFTISSTIAQDDFNTRWNAAFELANAEQYDEALAAFEPLLVEQPGYADTHVQMAWCYLIKGNMEKTGEHVQTALQLDLLNPSVYAISSYFLYIMDNSEGGKVFLNDAMWFSPNDGDLNYYQDDVTKMKNAGLSVDQLAADLQEIVDNDATRNKQWANIQTPFFKAVEILNEGNNAEAKAAFKEVFPMFENVPEQQQRFVYNLTYVISTYYYNVGDTTNYMPLLTRTYDHMKENQKTNYSILLHMNTLLGEHYYNAGQYEKSFEIISEGLNHFTFINAYSFLGSVKAQFLTQYTASALAVGNMGEARDGGKLVTELTYTGFDEWYTVNALTYIAQSWQEEDAVKAKEYYQQAYDLASESGFEDLKNSIAPNLK